MASAPAPKGSKKIPGGKLALYGGIGVVTLIVFVFLFKGKGSSSGGASTGAAYPPGYYSGVVPGQGSATDSSAGQALMQLSDQYAQTQQAMADQLKVTQANQRGIHRLLGGQQQIGAQGAANLIELEQLQHQAHTPNLTPRQLGLVNSRNKLENQALAGYQGVPNPSPGFGVGPSEAVR